MKNIFFLLLLLISISCYHNKETNFNKLTLVPKDTLLYWVKTNTFPKSKNILIKDQNGNIITYDSIIKIKNPRDFKRDYYRNDKNEIVEIVFSIAKDEDKLFFDKMNKIEESYRNNDNIIINVPVKCKDKKKLLEEVLFSDQQNRKNGVSEINSEIDRRNLSIVSSLMNKCGLDLFNDLEEKHRAAIFLVIQHSNKIGRQLYYPLLEKATEKGKFNKSDLALIKDRMLLIDQGKKQIYGSQIIDGKLGNLFEPNYVDQRRAKVGLGPLNEYLKQYNINFNVPQKIK